MPSSKEPIWHIKDVSRKLGLGSRLQVTHILSETEHDSTFRLHANNRNQLTYDIKYILELGYLKARKYDFTSR